MKTISPRRLKLLMAGEDPVLLLDVREPWEHEVCHIEGSRHIPMQDVPEALDELDRTTHTVVLCHHGIRSEQVGAYLERSGFARITNLEGGIDAWAQEVDPDMPQY